MMMNSINFTVVILISFTLLGCASRKDKVFKDISDSEDLIEVFDLKKEDLEKFSIVKKESKKKEITKKSSKIKKKVKGRKERKKELEKKYKKKNKDNEIEKNEDNVLAEESTISDLKQVEPEYPEDYPDKMKEMDEKSEKVWALFRSKIYPGEEFIFAISYMGITAGHIKLSTLNHSLLKDKEVFHLVARIKSARFYKYIYTLNDKLETLISKDKFLPLKYSLIQRESGQKVDDLQLFDHQNLKTYFWYKRLKRGKTKKIEKNVFIPKFFQDSYSALHFVRGLPLNIGDRYEFPVITRGNLWILKIKVAEIEEIKILNSKVSAIKIIAETHFPGVLKKRGDIVFWYSADEFKKLLKFEAKIKIGKVRGELVDYKYGKLNGAKTSH